MDRGFGGRSGEAIATGAYYSRGDTCAGVFKLDLPRVIADESNDLTPTMRRLLAELFEDLGRLEKRIAEVTREIEGLAARDEAARRLMTVPGIGPLAATALLAAAGNGQQVQESS